MHLYLYFNEKNLKQCNMFIYVCIYIHVCMHVCINFTVKLKYPCNCCCFAEPPAQITLECSLNVDVKENSNFIVTEPCKVFRKSIFYDFHYYLYLFEYLFMHLYTFISTF